MPSDVEPFLLTVAQAAALLHIGKDKTYELIASGKLPSVRLGERSVRVPRALLERWIESTARGGRVA